MKSMTVRSAPASGYDFPEKQQFRQRVWNSLANGATNRHGPIKNHPCLLLPSSEGTEIDVAESFGMARRNIVVVDRNPEIVEDLARRYPDIMTMPYDVGEACDRLATLGIKLGAASIDLCGPMCPSTFDTLERMAKADCWLSGAHVAVNILRGREPKKTTDLWRSNPLFTVDLKGGDKLDGARYASVMAAFSGSHDPKSLWPYSTTYVSTGGSSFLTVFMYLNRRWNYMMDYVRHTIVDAINQAR